MRSLQRMILVLAVSITALSANVFASECATCKGSWKAGGGAFFAESIGGKNSGFSQISIVVGSEYMFRNGKSLSIELLYSHEDNIGKRYGYAVNSRGILGSIGFYKTLGSRVNSPSRNFFYSKFGAGFAKTTFENTLPEYSEFSSSSAIIADLRVGILTMFSSHVGLDTAFDSQRLFVRNSSDRTALQLGVSIVSLIN
jgi:hypothetical protein